MWGLDETGKDPPVALRHHSRGCLHGFVECCPSQTPRLAHVPGGVASSRQDRDVTVSTGAMPFEMGCVGAQAAATGRLWWRAGALGSGDKDGDLTR